MNCNTTHYRANSSSVPGDPTDSIAFERAAWTFAVPGPASDLLAIFRDYYGPTMNAYAAAAAGGREAALHAELSDLFASQARETAAGTAVDATFLKVTVRKPG